MRRPTILIMALAGGVLAAALVLLYTCNPETAKIYPPCLLHALTGLYCPGCGALRAMHHLLHGDIVGALRKNPLLVLSIPAIAFLLLRPSWQYKVWVPWLVLGIFLTYGVLRNIPVWPLALLAPH
jgi:hypothetical protein